MSSHHTQWRLTDAFVVLPTWGWYLAPLCVAATKSE